jgi:hypothetical protein
MTLEERTAVPLSRCVRPFVDEDVLVNLDKLIRANPGTDDGRSHDEESLVKVVPGRFTLQVRVHSGKR